MVTKNFLELAALPGTAAIAGGWKLMPGQAISLRPGAPGVLRVVQGQVWATLDGSRPACGDVLGDHILQAGQQLAVRAGQHLVFETFARANETPVYFEWTPLAAPLYRRAERCRAALVRPLRDLAQALRMAGGALRQLLWGLAGYGEYLTAGRGRVPRSGVSPQPGQAGIHGTQRVTAGSRVGAVSQRVCRPSSCM